MTEENQSVPEVDDDEEVILERIVPEEEDNTPPPDRFDRIRPIFECLNVDGVNLNLDTLQNNFNRLWQYEEGDTLDADEQHLMTVALFIYLSHLALDDFSINTVRAREHIKKALTEWTRPEIEKQVAAEKATDNPFKTFVEQGVPRIDEAYSWRNFLLEHKKQDEKGWDYKMKQCWFNRFFVRYGRVDYIESACEYDRIPWRAREDYVDLKLTNTFAKLGSFCQFKYTPKK